MNITRKRTKRPTEAQEQEIRSKVGKMSDARVAELVGVSFSHVRRIRVESNVQACYSRERPLLRLHGVIGKYPDSAVAKFAGVSRQRIHQYREKHNIPAPPSMSEFVQHLLQLEVLD